MMVKSVVLALGLFCALVMGGCSPARSIVSIGNDGLSAAPEAWAGVYLMDSSEDKEDEYAIFSLTEDGRLSVTLCTVLDDSTKEDLARARKETEGLLTFLELIDEGYLDVVTFTDEAEVSIECVSVWRYEIALLQAGERVVGELSNDRGVQKKLDEYTGLMLNANVHMYVVIEMGDNGELRYQIISTDDLHEDEFDESSGALLLNQEKLRAMLVRVAGEMELLEDQLVRTPYTVTAVDGGEGEGEEGIE